MQFNESKKDTENIHSYDNGFHPKEVHLKDNYRIYRTNIFYKFFNKVAIAIFILMMFCCVELNCKDTNKNEIGCKKVQPSYHPHNIPSRPPTDPLRKT